TRTILRTMTPRQRPFYQPAHPLGARVPRAFGDRRLARARGLRVSFGERVFDQAEEVFAAARDAQDVLHRLVFGERRDDHGLPCGEVLAHLDGRPVARERALSFPRQHAHIKPGGVARQLVVGDRRQEVRVRQALDLDAARLVADEDPLPRGALARGAADQLLVNQPRLYRAEVAEPWALDARHFCGDFQTALGDARPVLEVHGLLQKVRALAPARGLLQELA